MSKQSAASPAEGEKPTKKGWPEPTMEEPDMLEVNEQADEEGGCEATDGCWVEPDGVCEHGHPSWLIVWGMI